MTNRPTAFLPYARQAISEDDVQAVVDVLRGDWLTTGPAVNAFEAIVAEKIGARHVVACSNGSTALHLAVLGLGLGDGHVAIVPAVTFQATASAAILAGAEVVFADVDPDTALMTPANLEEAISRAKTRFPDHAIRCALPVHIAGRGADMPALSAVAERFGLSLIEDAAHALGTVSQGDAVGACRHSHATTFSFHAVKTVTCGEGGAVATNDDEAAARMRQLCNHGIVRNAGDFVVAEQAFDKGEPNPWYYEVVEPAYNYRITDLQCALGLSQMCQLDAFIRKRDVLLARYGECLSNVEGVEMALPPEAEQTSWHLAVALIDFQALGTSRGDVMRGLLASGIGTQVHYMPLYRHPWSRTRYGEMTLAGAEAYYARALSLPLHVSMSEADVDRVCETLQRILKA